MRRNSSDDKTLSTLNASWRFTEKTSKIDHYNLFSKSESDIAATFHHGPSYQELLSTLRTNSFCGNFQPSISNILGRDDEWIRLPKRQKNKDFHIFPILSRADESLDGSLESTVPCIVEICPNFQSDAEKKRPMEEFLRGDIISQEMRNLSLSSESPIIFSPPESKFDSLES
jgi:hypothetical protein